MGQVARTSRRRYSRATGCTLTHRTRQHCLPSPPPSFPRSSDASRSSAMATLCSRTKFNSARYPLNRVLPRFIATHVRDARTKASCLPRAKYSINLIIYRCRLHLTFLHNSVGFSFAIYIFLILQLYNKISINTVGVNKKMLLCPLSFR